jgi:RNA polymerase-binding protein DksA
VAKTTPKKTSKTRPAARPARKRPPVAKPTPKAAVKAPPGRPKARAANLSHNNGGNSNPWPPAPAGNPDKPIKNKAGLKSRDLAFFRDLLIAKRRELIGDVHSMEQEALQSLGGSNLSNLPIHMADMGTDNYEQEFTLGLVEKDRQLLREINLALCKIRDGMYGVCEGTGKAISRARLEAQPWARYSIDHARRLERHMGHR